MCRSRLNNANDSVSRPSKLVLFYIFLHIYIISSQCIGLASILVMMAVSTFKTDDILYFYFYSGSLPNVSTDIRWSLDLRWQKPSEPIGFYNLKEGVLMRSSKDSDLDINWKSFNNVDRHEEQKKATVKIVSCLQDNFYTSTL